MGCGGKEALLTHTGRPGDAGLDGIIRQDALGLDQVGVQAKRYDRESAVQRPDVPRNARARRGHPGRSAVEITARCAAQDAERANVQKALNEAWAALTANEPDVVLSTLEEAFEDNEAPAAAVGVANGEASLVVLVPSTDALPERRPTVTDAGNLSLRKLTKSDKADLYKLLVAGYVLVTIREAFAVAPSLVATRVAVLRASVPDAYGARRLECLLAARFTRQALAGIR
jgi:restriction endonuclease Mrr